MDEIKALTIVTSLANGVDPRSGEVFPDDSPYQSADVVRALYLAGQALQKRSKAKKSGGIPENAGKPWTQEEDTKLLASFDKGVSVKELAELHSRTEPGIQARLERHGKLPSQWRGTSRNSPAGGSSTG